MTLPQNYLDAIGPEFTDYVPPTWDVRFMKQVYLVAESSKDPSTKIGAILVKDKNVISSGYNGFARNVIDSTERYNDREIKYKFIVHGEANAILTAARLGISTINTTLYTQAIPCNECMKSVIQAGITEIVIHSKWPMSHSKWEESSKISDLMIKEVGIKVREFNEFLGVKGYVNGRVINV